MLIIFGNVTRAINILILRLSVVVLSLHQNRWTGLANFISANVRSTNEAIEHPLMKVVLDQALTRVSDQYTDLN